MVTSNKCDLVVVDPALMDYRVGLWDDINKVIPLRLYCGTIQVTDCYRFEINKVRISNFLGVHWYSDVLAYVIKNRPQKLLISFDSKSITMWLLLFASKVLRIDCYIFGHGLFKSGNYFFLRKILYLLLLRLATKYLCYNKLVYESLKSLNVGRFFNIDNVVSNEFPIFPSAKTGYEQGVLFIGRNRPGAELELLISAVTKINDLIDNKIILHIIGDDCGLKYIYEDVPELIFYGQVFDKKIISDISVECRVGAYAGDAGLSVLHYMSLSLPVIVHSSLAMHMGPEPYSVIDGYNGFNFIRLDLISLISAINKSFELDFKGYRDISINSYTTYENKVKPFSYSDRLIEALK